MTTYALNLFPLLSLGFAHRDVSEFGHVQRVSPARAVYGDARRNALVLRDPIHEIMPVLGSTDCFLLYHPTFIISHVP